MPTIAELSNRAGLSSREMTAELGIEQRPMLTLAFASGIDVALTIMEASTGAYFKGLSHESAIEVVRYFQEEADRSENTDRQIASFYRAWANVIAAEYISQ